MDMAEELLCFNGINGATGDYGLPPMTGEELARQLSGAEAPENLSELRHRSAQQQEQGHYGVKEGIDPKKLDESGWGVIFAHDGDPAVEEALAPLMALRREQAGDRFRRYAAGEGVRPGESKTKFLARHGAGPGPADPAKVPYYLLLVGSPEVIPYRFQSQIDVQYAVGRICFDTVEEYANYAASVVAAERGLVTRSRQVSFFGVTNPGDKATQLAERSLVSPLARYLDERRGDWQIEAIAKEAATKANLSRLLIGEASPAVLFAASHGMEFPLGDSRQLPHQGALLCGDWPGPAAWQGQGPIPQDFYLAADDLTSDARLAGLIGFFFACFGAGTPRHDEFARQAFKSLRAETAPMAFLAALPSKMLSHPKGGALAVIGHVERAWGYSFAWQGAGAQTAVFESTFDRLLDGHPIGSALEYFNERYAELSTVLADQLEEIEFGAVVDPYELAGLWTANNDARGYTVIGDPAVRLAVAAAGEAARAPSPWVMTPNEAPPPTPVLPVPPADEGPEALAFTVGATEEPATSEADDVRFSAYHPRALEVGEPKPLLVYTHLEAALAAIEADASGRLGHEAKAYRRGEATRGATLAPGAEITVVPQGDGLAFEPPQATLVWSGSWQRADFRMSATGSRVGHVIEGTVSCYVGPLLVADIRLPVVVPRAGETIPPGPESSLASTKMYPAVFASYSHADTPVVEAMEAACKALGMDYLRDVMTLKSGQSWSDKLLSMVEKADIFQLFWSPSASESAYVEQEWQHALRLAERKGKAFIRPIYWQRPMARVPAALSHLHFAPVELPSLVAKAPVPAAAPARHGLALAGDVAALATLTVSTWAAVDPAAPEGERLLARTRVGLTGEVDTWLAEAGVAAAQLRTHASTVSAALKARLDYLELLARRAGD